MLGRNGKNGLTQPRFGWSGAGLTPHAPQRQNMDRQKVLDLQLEGKGEPEQESAPPILVSAWIQIKSGRYIIILPSSTTDAILSIKHISSSLGLFAAEFFIVQYYSHFT